MDAQSQTTGNFGPSPDDDRQWPPFRSFGTDYYTYQLLLDLKLGKDWAVRTEPHPRFYTNPTDTAPIAVPALLRTEWWPMISFVVFKSPAEGRTHVFRSGEPMLQILILPVTADFTLVPMNEEEAAEREMRGRRIHSSKPRWAINGAPRTGNSGEQPRRCLSPSCTSEQRRELS
jgi:hypothetical protein